MIGEGAYFQIDSKKVKISPFPNHTTFKIHLPGSTPEIKDAPHD